MERVSLVRITDADGAEYDHFAVIPPGMDKETAKAIVDAAILQCQQDDPDEFNYDQLNALLEPHGLYLPDSITADNPF